jgi:uncharacterized protein
MDTSTVLWIAAIALVIIGVAGTVLPALPGIPLVFGGLLLAAYADGFSHVGAIPLVILGILAALAMAVDFFAAMLGAKRVGASRYALVGAAIGTLAGIAFGLFGLLLGPFVGAAAGEFIAHKNINQATKVGFGTWLGLVLGAALKIAIVFTMLGVFVTAYFIDR